ncbi:MAG: hypothetical protein ACRDT4_27610 [Micromonosporaceae bacterium]
MKTLWILRIFLVPYALAVVAQPVLAGAYLSGEYDALVVHQVNSIVLHSLATLALFAAVAYWLGGRGRGWPALVLLVLWVVIGFQAGFGYERQLALHIPVGVGIVLTSVWLAVWSFTAAARRTRPPRAGSRRARKAAVKATRERVPEEVPA